MKTPKIWSAEEEEEIAVTHLSRTCILHYGSQESNNQLKLPTLRVKFSSTPLRRDRVQGKRHGAQALRASVEEAAQRNLVRSMGHVRTVRAGSTVMVPVQQVQVLPLHNTDLVRTG